jgi:hypothetical protein
MKNGQYEVGDQVTAYYKVDTVKEKCDHGGTHNVPVYIVKRLTITHIVKEMITALHYTHDGVGDVLYAIDRQGRSYRKEPHWDGPRATGWITKTNGFGARPYYFDQFPMKVYSRDLTGRGFIP